MTLVYPCFLPYFSYNIGMEQQQQTQQRVLINAKGQELTTTLTDGQAFERLADLVDKGERDGFAEDLIIRGRKYNNISEQQFWWIHKLGQPQAPLCEVEVYEIWCRFDAAHQNGVKTKHLRKEFPCEDSTVILSFCGPRSKYYGDIWVTGPGKYPDNKLYGRIQSGCGTLLGRGVPEAVQKLVVQINEHVDDHLPW